MRKIALRKDTYGPEAEMTIALTESSRTEVPIRRRERLADRHPVALFTTLAFALSWWPAVGRFGNPESAVVIPIGPSIAGALVIGWRTRRHGLGELARAEHRSHVGPLRPEENHPRTNEGTRS